MSKKGLWVSQNEFRSFAAADPVRSLSSEIATRQRSIDFYSIGMSLPNPDPVLKKMGKDITVYKELRSDPIVHGCITSRKAGTKKLLWEIDRGKAKSRQAKYITDAIKALPVDRIIGQMLNAPLYGYQPMEVMWDIKTWTPTDVVAKPPHWFVFDESNNLRFRTKANWALGEELQSDGKDKKFLVATNDADYENPYGFPILSTCFWPVTFRKGGFKFWITFTEKFGMPFIVGKQPRSTDKIETDAFADMLEQMVQDAIAVIPDDSSVEIPETKNTGSADLYDKLINACKSEISVALLGHSGGAISTPGKLGGEDQAVGVRDDIVNGDKKIPEECFNTLIQWTAEYKFSERTDLPEFILYEEEDVDLDQATRDELLTKDGRLKPTKTYYMKNYGFEEEDIDIVEPVVPPPPAPTPSPLAGEGGVRGQQFSKTPHSALATPHLEGQQAIDDALANLDPAALQAQMEGVLKPVIDLINNGSSYEEIMKNLATAYPDMDAADLEEMLARAIFVAETWGRLTAEASRAKPKSAQSFSMKNFFASFFHKSEEPALERFYRGSHESYTSSLDALKEFSKSTLEAIKAVASRPLEVKPQDINLHVKLEQEKQPPKQFSAKAVRNDDGSITFDSKETTNGPQP